MKVTNKMKIISLVAATTIASFALALPASAIQVKCMNGAWANDMSGCAEWANNPNKNINLQQTATTVINVILGIVGFIAVLMIIIGGISYSTSAGDPTKVKKAKDTIMYGIIGLVIALLAFAIVNFILTNL